MGVRILSSAPSNEKARFSGPFSLSASKQANEQLTVLRVRRPRLCASGLVVVAPRAARINVNEPFSTQIGCVEHEMEMRRDRLVGCTGSLAQNTIAMKGSFDPVVVLPKIALVELDVLGSECDLQRFLLSVRFDHDIWLSKKSQEIGLPCRCFVFVRDGMSTIDRLL